LAAMQLLPRSRRKFSPPISKPKNLFD
jgi:hypothetical protein